MSQEFWLAQNGTIIKQVTFKIKKFNTYEDD